MITFIKALFAGVKPYIKDVWYNQSCYIAERKFPIVFNGENYIWPKEGLCIVMGEKSNGKKIYYKIINTWRSKGSDWFSPSDAVNCNLKFSHIK